MENKNLNMFLAVGVVLLFLLSSIGSGVGGSIQTAQQDSSSRNDLSTNNGVIASCVIGGIQIKKQISVESCQCLRQLFSALVEANANDPCGEGTRMLKVRFIELLAGLGLVSHGFSVNDVCSLIEPPWSRDALSQQRAHLMSPRSLGDENNATLWLCSMAGSGFGVVLPPFLLPRPRVLMYWRGFYPDSSVVSVAEMATGRGVIAQGTQVGAAFGFIGIGFAFAFPGFPTNFGFIGYSLMTRVHAADMKWYHSNFPPLVMDESPANGAVQVPLSLSELKFTLKDFDGDKLSYHVVTSPDIGSGANVNVGNGVYSVPVSGLEDQTTYTWTVNVTDGIDTVVEMFDFTTESLAPIISNPLPADGASHVSTNLQYLRFTLKDDQGDAMDYTVETSPFIGSGSGTNVHNGTYSVGVSGLQNQTVYHWFVNATDGVHWKRKTFSFETSYPTKGNILVYTTGGLYGKSYFDNNLPTILENHGYSVTVTDRNEIPVITDGLLSNYDELWILSTNSLSNGCFSTDEINRILNFKEEGNGLLIMADQVEPPHDYAKDANQISIPLGVTFFGLTNHGPEGNPIYPDFTEHALFVGVESVVGEPNEGNMYTVSQAEVVAIYHGDNLIAINDDGNGRAVFDVSFQRLWNAGVGGYNWILVGDTPQYVKNIADWLKL